MEAAPVRANVGEYFTNDDQTVRVAAMLKRPELFPRVKAELATYKWNDSDFLLATYPKTGTNLVWEIMMMLLKGSPDYITTAKLALMIDQIPISDGLQAFPSPRVLNSHYRTDVLPPEFRKGKTVIVARNPKDTCVSKYQFMQGLKIKKYMGMSFGEFLLEFLHDKDTPYGRYFDYLVYMWSRRDDANVLAVFYEDFIMYPVETIQKLNEFMGKDRSPELVQQIADATSFDKMKKAKTAAATSGEMLAVIKGEALEMKKVERALVAQTTFRKGGIGGWKNHFTVADNELFDEFLTNWEGGKSIPFRYE
ncbi:sulfotransferase 1C2-like [Watersipora subatra]|uniref:sulfotransferase 1C2-like n=1 Tax=Watersipora subatra TaxID=2589382 RepID=UPI00355C3090